MSEHLTKEKLEMLSSRKLRGKELFSALKHIENCQKCRVRVKLPTTEEILKRLEPDTDSHLKSETTTQQKK